MADDATAEALYREARTRCQQGDIAAGIDLVQRAIALAPDHARAHGLLGMAFSSAGRYQEALKSLDRAIALGSTDAYGSRADALVALGRLAEAVESFDRALAHDPDSVADWCNRGAALIDLGRASEAAESFARERALAIKPDYVDALNNRANALDRLGRLPEALESADAALARAPEHVDALVT